MIRRLPPADLLTIASYVTFREAEPPRQCVTRLEPGNERASSKKCSELLFLPVPRSATGSLGELVCNQRHVKSRVATDRNGGV